MFFLLLAELLTIKESHCYGEESFQWSTFNYQPVTSFPPIGPVTFRIVNHAYDYEVDLSLSEPDRTGKRTVHLTHEGSTHPICDDNFTDMDATLLCSQSGFAYGRRTSKPTRKKFYATNLSCFLPENLDAELVTYETRTYTLLSNTIYLQTCTSLKLYDDNVLPCTQNQAAAAYCWSYTPFAIDVAIDSIKVTKTKWSIVFKMFDFKFGRWFNTLEKALGNYEILESDFRASHCDTESYKTIIKEKTSQIAVTGDFQHGCYESCVDLYYLGHHLFPFYMCPDAQYTMQANYTGFETADIDYNREN